MDDLLFDRKSLLLKNVSSFDNLKGIKIYVKTRGQSQLYLLAKKIVDEKFVLPRFLQSCYTDQLARGSEGNLLAR